MTLDYKEGIEINRTCIKAFLITMIPFLLLYAFSKSVLGDVYLFEWTARRYYCGVWFIVLLLVVFNHRTVSYSLSVGNAMGIAAGQLIGDRIIAIRTADITTRSTPEEVYLAHEHYGVFLWLMILMLSFVAGIVIEKLQRKRQPR